MLSKWSLWDIGAQWEWLRGQWGSMGFIGVQWESVRPSGGYWSSMGLSGGQWGSVRNVYTPDKNHLVQRHCRCHLNSNCRFLIICWIYALLLGLILWRETLYIKLFCWHRKWNLGYLFLWCFYLMTSYRCLKIVIFYHYLIFLASHYMLSHLICYNIML